MSQAEPHEAPKGRTRLDQIAEALANALGEDDLDLEAEDHEHDELPAVAAGGSRR